jgi:tetratricopeptide (TPR) repeat protein
MKKPLRVAWLEPDLTFDPGDEHLARAAQLVLQVAAFEATVRHPEIAVTDIDDAHVTNLDGAFVPLHALRVPSNEASAFEVDRRDALLWLELSLTNDAKSRVRLHAKEPSGAVEVFDAVGPLSQAIDRAMASFLATYGLGPLPRGFEPFDRGSLVEVVRGIAPRLSAEAASRPGYWTVASHGEVAAEVEEDEEVVEDEDEDEEEDEEDDEEDEDAEEDEEDDEDEEDEEDEEAGAALGGGRTRSLADLGLELPGVLRVAVLRTIGVAFDVPVHEAILAIDAENPWALRDLFFERLGRGRDFALLRRCIAAAPSWGKPYLSMYVPEDEDEGDRDLAAGVPSEDEEGAAFAWAALCMPANEYALAGHAERLDAADRDAEAMRVFRRLAIASESDPRAWKAYLASLRENDRIGAYVREGESAVARLRAEAEPDPSFTPPDLLHLDLELSTAYLNVGRLGEAVVLRQNRLEGRAASWRNATAVLAGWRSSPVLYAQSYAREGYYRGEDARVLEGFCRAAPGDGLDLAMFIEALVARGSAEEAAYAFAQLGRGRDLVGPSARVAAVRALVASGRLEAALDESVTLQLRYPRAGHDAALAHALRLLAAVPASRLDAVVERHLSRGGARLARIFARDVADFCPGASRSASIARALGPERPAPFRAGALAPAPAALDDLFTAALASEPDDVAAADRLVDAWHDAASLATSRVEHVRALFYALARAVHAHLGCRRAVVGGALRTVAHEALLALGALREHVAPRDVTALFVALEPAAEVAHPDDLRSWLVRVEQALGLEDLCLGRVERFLVGAPTCEAHLVTPERSAVLEAELARPAPEGSREASLAAHEAHFWSSGADLSGEWSSAAVAALAPDEALDVSLLAAFAGQGWNAMAAGEAGVLLLGRGQVDDALDVLCRGLGAAGEDYRDALLARLAGPWKQAKVPVPLAFAKAASRVFEALQGGKPEKAIAAGRWIVALEDDNAEAHRNLGLAYAMVGDAVSALAHLERWSRAESVQVAAGTLYQSGHREVALRVAELGSQWFTRAEAWVTLASLAYQAEDNAIAERAYANALAIDPDAVDASNLNAYATVLAEMGDFAASERVSKRMSTVAGKDPTWAAFALLNRSTAELGLGRHDEALATAKQAAAKNKNVEYKKTFDDAIAAAKSKKAPPVKDVAARPGLAARWFEDRPAPLDPAAPADLVDVARRARFRFDSERTLASTPRMADGARLVLSRTAGALDPTLALARSFALDLRAQASFPRDPAPPLGDRPTRADLYREFRARGGVIVGDAGGDSRVAIDDRARVPGSHAPTVRDLAALLRALGGGRPREVLAARGLDHASYEALCDAWRPHLAEASVARSLEALLAE